MYESSGLNGQSTIRKLDPMSGEVIESHKLDDQYFGEGLAIANGKAYQLTYKKRVGFIYDIADLSQTPATFTFESTTNEGWGFTYDESNNEFIMSDGSQYLHFWDGNTLAFKRKVEVTRQKGKQSKNINELEYWHDRVLANVW